jgi:hypothetical protein
MPKTSDMIPSRFLKKGDIGPGILVTIKDVELVTFKEDTADAESRWILHFEENEKGLSLNKTNIQMLEIICANDDTDFWKGKQVVLYWDPTVDFMGKIVGGIRIRAPKSDVEKALPF